MQFGLFSLADNGYPPEVIARTDTQWYQQYLDEVRLAESLGYASVAVGEHHFSHYGISPSPQVLLAYVAAITQHVRLSPAIAVLPYSDPLRVAEDYALLDQLSGGRLDFAVGRGFLPVEFNGFNIPMEENRDRFRENLEIITLAWKGEPFSYNGRFRTVRNVQVVPQPLQSPVPLYISVFSPPTLEWATQQGYNVILAPFAAAANFGSMETALSHYREEAVKHGHDHLEARCSYFVYVIDEHEPVNAQQQEAVEAMIRYFRTTAQDFPEGEVPEHMKYWLALRERLSSITPDMLNTNSVIFGTPAFCVEQFKRVEAAGISQVICYFDFGGIPPERIERNIRLFAEQVMPHFSATDK